MDQLKKGEIITLQRVTKDDAVCPVAAMKKLVDSRPKLSNKVFVHLDSSDLTRYQFQAVLKKAANFLGWQSESFSSHSFRIGAATTAAINGVPEDIIIKKKGDGNHVR